MRPQMRWLCARPGWLRALLIAGATLFVPLAAPAASDSKSELDAKPIALGTGPAYRILGQLPMMHEGRVKPIDTVAREEVKQIYTRETIKLPAKDGKPGATWLPVAAFLDWSVRPKFWDAQPIIAVEYLPLKRLIFAEEVRQALATVAGKAATPAPTRKSLLELADYAEIDAAQLRNVVRDSGLAEADGKSLLALAARIGEETKWMAPEDLEAAQVTIDGTAIPFLAWLEKLIEKSQGMGEKAKLTDVEEKAVEVAKRLSHYRAIRDREPTSRSQVPLLAMPRPANAAMIAYTADAVKKVQEVGEKGLGPLELESVEMISKFLNDIPGKDRSLPGQNAEFDARYTAWLKDKSAWVPVGVIREASVDELTRAGYPTARIEAFRNAFKAVEDEELTRPGQADPQPSLALIEAAHALGDEVNASVYPSIQAMGRETHFNDVAPFFKAPIAYLAGLLLLCFSLMASSFGKAMKWESMFGKLSHAFYLAGLAGFAAGIGLEVYGFYLRVMITGWAPVSNMYETVIWVALVASILGLVIEGIYRRTYAALAACGVALVGTFLAANVELLDPSIKQLPPVLRSNFWLSIHVLTIVSSYAAFALAMGLGMVATGTYLVATYKRSASLSELATPLLLGIPIAGFGSTVAMRADRINLGSFWASYGYYAALVVAGGGVLLIGMAVFALVGELINRVVFAAQVRRAARAEMVGSTAAQAGVSPGVFAAAGASGGTMTMLPPVPATKPPQWTDPEFLADARLKVMQQTAAQIKPMASFIYRSMQVGILLVAAGTFLGGWWADVSWGRFWGWDPKEVWALITLLVYLMPLHARFAGWVNTFWMVMASVVCFLSVLMAWYGVNFVLGVGLHSYGFTNGGGQGVVGAVTLVALTFAAGAYWRRKRSSEVVSVA